MSGADLLVLGALVVAAIGCVVVTQDVIVRVKRRLAERKECHPHIWSAVRPSALGGRVKWCGACGVRRNVAGHRPIASRQ